MFIGTYYYIEFYPYNNNNIINILWLAGGSADAYYLCMATYIGI